MMEVEIAEHTDGFHPLKTTRERVEAVCAVMFEDQGLTDWRLSVETMAKSGRCDNQSKTIRLSDEHLDRPFPYVFESLVHELAHVEVEDEESLASHHSGFYRRFGELMKRYSRLVSIPTMQLRRLRASVVEVMSAIGQDKRGER